MPLLQVKNLQVRVEEREILHGLSLTVNQGEVHAIMGPNGSGKSTLSHVIAGKPGYEVTSGEVLFEGEDLLAMSPDERAAKGVFLAFQYPGEIPGVATMTFLRTALNAARLALGIERGAQERHGRDTRDFHRILERQEHALRRTFVRRHLQQVLTVEQDFAAGDLIARLAGDDVAERRLAGAVRPHDGVDFALVHGERKPVENFTLLDTDLQIFDLE